MNTKSVKVSSERVKHLKTIHMHKVQYIPSSTACNQTYIALHMAKEDSLRLRQTLFPLIKLRQRLKLLPKNPNPKMPDGVPNLIHSVLPRRHGKDLVQFLQRKSCNSQH